MTSRLSHSHASPRSVMMISACLSVGAYLIGAAGVYAARSMPLEEISVPSMRTLKHSLLSYLPWNSQQSQSTPQIIVVTPQAQPEPSPSPPPETEKGGLPVDQVALMATSGDDSYDDGGIDVITSNPISLSNPINLKGGNYVGQANNGFGR